MPDHSTIIANIREICDLARFFTVFYQSPITGRDLDERSISPGIPVSACRYFADRVQTQQTCSNTKPGKPRH
jgi:hypothetical protein